MSQLTYCDPIAQLAAAHHLTDLLTRFRDITRRFGQPVHEALWLRGEAQRVLIDNVDRLTSSPRLKPGDSNSFMLRVQCERVGAVIPRGFLLVPASLTLSGPQAGVGLGRQ